MNEFKTGCVYGRLTVIGVGEQYVSPKGRRVSRWKCECVCGNIVDVVPSKLRSGHTSSCGCFKLDKATFHGHNKPGERTATYRSYDNMRSRCYNEKAAGYCEYGGRGIEVCSRWVEKSPGGFLNFLEDMGEKPENSLLDRINVNGNYCKENCRWVTRSVSNFNRRKLDKNTSGRTGVSWSDRCSKWVARIHENSEEFILGYFDSFDEAVRVREVAELNIYEELKPEAREYE